MKTLRIFSFVAILMALTHFSFAQKVKTETLHVSGNCGMCKKTIEKSAKEAGASNAVWNADTKMLTLKYNSAATSTAKIQQSIAAAGYDTRDYKATYEAYNKLHACCQYDRAVAAQADCCGDGKCEMKDGKCLDISKCKEMECCKTGTCGKKS